MGVIDGVVVVVQILKVRRKGENFSRFFPVKFGCETPKKRGLPCALDGIDKGSIDQ